MGKSVDVVLVQNVDDLGKFGEQKRVKAGFARNYLIPNGLALYQNKETKFLFKSYEKKEQKRKEHLQKDAEALKKAVADKKLTFNEKTHDNGKLYGSVNQTRLSDGIKSEFGVDVSKKYIQLKTPIKEAGDYTIQVDVEDVLSFSFNLSIVSIQEKAAKGKKAAEPEAKAEVSTEDVSDVAAEEDVVVEEESQESQES